MNILLIFLFSFYLYEYITANKFRNFNDFRRCGKQIFLFAFPHLTHKSFVSSVYNLVCILVVNCLMTSLFWEKMRYIIHLGTSLKS